MSIIRPSSLSPQEMETLLSQLADRGARITMADPRVTSIQTWLLATIGVALVGGVGWGIKSINDLNQTMATMITRYEYESKRVDRAERHIESVDGRVIILERKVKM